MTKNLLTLSLFFLLALKINAQCTPDNTITKPGFYPSSLPAASVGTAYNEVIQFKIIKDTTIDFGGPQKATVDSATIDSVSGMPNGITFKLNKTRKTYTPVETGCALISGIPTKEGTFPIKIYLKLYGKIGTFSATRPQVIDNFSISVGVSSVNSTPNDSKIIYPNPLNTDKLSFNSNQVLAGTLISIYNYSGQLLASQIYDGNQSGISFNYPKGLYFVSLSNGDKVSRVKLVKE